MSPQLAFVAYSFGILLLFALDRDASTRPSKALWLPVTWLWIVGSREVSQWLGVLGFSQAGTSGSLNYYTEGSPIDRAVYLGLSVSGIVVLLHRGTQVRRVLRANVPVVFFFLYCAASILWSDYPEIAFKRWIKAIGDIVMVLIVLTDPYRSKAVQRLISRVGFLLIPLSVLLIKYYPELGKGYKAASGAPVYSGATTNKNLLGITCLIFGLGAVWRFLCAFKDRGCPRRKHHLIAQGALLTMVLWLFWMANSMTSFLCFLLGSGLMIAITFRRLNQRLSLVHVLVATTIAVSFCILFLGLGKVALDTMGRDPTLTGRTAIWDLVLSLRGNPLWGTGFESFWLGPRLVRIWSLYWWHPNEAHNGYLEVYLNLGWIGLALLAALVISGYRNILDALRRDYQLGQLKLAFFVVAIIYNFTEAGFRMLDPVWIAFLLSIIALPVDAAPYGVPAAEGLETFRPQLVSCMMEGPNSWNP